MKPSYKMGEQGVIYLKCLKALYSHIEAARLFYDDLNESLMKKMGFKQNPYDSCIYNKHTKNGTLHRRAEHDYLGMIMRYSNNKQSVTINMQKYVEDCIGEFVITVPEEMLKEAATPSTRGKTIFGCNTIKNLSFNHSKAIICSKKRMVRYITCSVLFNNACIESISK